MQTVLQSVAFEGMLARPIEVQCSLQSGLPAFTIVGLADRAVSEARDRIRAAFYAIALAFPAKRVTINLAPADTPKSGPQFDLAIALSILAAMDVVPKEALNDVMALGELALDARLLAIKGALPAALAAAEQDKAFLCPVTNASEAAWVENCTVFGASTLLRAVEHLRGKDPLLPAVAQSYAPSLPPPDMAAIHGQTMAKRALEISAAGGHNLLMIGPPGAGKSMLAKSFPSILPQPSALEILETAMVYSLSDGPAEKRISFQRPFRTPHHSATMAALIGGGKTAKPGEISLAHNGVLFLDELPEFQRSALEALREPLETGHIHLARAEARVSYPARLMLLAAANPCRCGHAFDAARACSRAPRCSEDYLNKLSGPLLDRFDIKLDIAPVPPQELHLAEPPEPSATIQSRVEAARQRQIKRWGSPLRCNADATLDALCCALSAEAQALSHRAAEHHSLSARGYHRLLRVARTIADLAAAEKIERPHIAEALILRNEKA